MENNFEFDLVLEKAEHRDGRMFVSGVASTTSVDLQNDAFSPNALKSMAEGALGKPLVTSHDHELGDEIGTIQKATVDGGKLYIEGELDPDDVLAQRLFKKIQKSGRAGFSVGASLLAVKPGINKSRILDDVRLNHVMITSKPVNRDTFCLAIKKALDKTPYGDDVKYADPGFQADKVKRYPLDTVEHIRAAASYFGMPKNRAEYTAEQIKHISDAIAEAEAQHGIGSNAKKAEDLNTMQNETVLKAGAKFSDESLQKLKAIHDSASDADTKSAIKDLVGASVDETFWDAPAANENVADPASESASEASADDAPEAESSVESVAAELPSDDGNGKFVGVEKALIDTAVNEALAPKLAELEAAIAVFKSETAKIQVAKASDAAPVAPKLSPRELRAGHLNDTDFVTHLLLNATQGG